MRRKPEILAPAGSIEGLKAAIAAGCDAVYIGGSRFGARAFADNPALDEMMDAIAYCHLHDVKIYLTVNTILKDREIQNALFSFLRSYYEAGIDAVIVQDMGVLHFIKEHFPSLAIHASTQMTLTMGKGTKLLKQYHVTRMVPARELTIEELCQMRKDTDLELEVFVHGALCYCYSGQCLFSSMLGGRSGNRGRCAQPCRMSYQCQGPSKKGMDRLAESKFRGIKAGDYLLSPKELCNLLYLPELIEAGVDSFKIEGRMKRPEYTAFVTAIYRKYADLYFSLGKKGYQRYLSEHEREWQEDLRCLAEIYNRSGFTQGYLEGLAGDITKRHPQKGGEMLASLRPKHGGVCVGEVLSVGRQEVVYRTSKRLSAQDVVEFRNAWQQPSYEYTLGTDVAANQKVTARYQKGSKIQAGDKVYRTKDAALLADIRERYIDSKRQLAVCGRLAAEKGKELRLLVERKSSQRVENGLAAQKVEPSESVLRGQNKETQQEVIRIECLGDIYQEANNHPATEESVKKALNQTGNSPFYFEELTVELSGSLFLPVGALKKLRRQAFELLETKITEGFRRNDTVPESDEKERNIQWSETTEIPNVGKASPVLTASVMTDGQLEAVLNCHDILVVYLQTEQMSAKELKQAYEKVLAAKKSPWLAMPNVFRHPVWKLFEKEWEKEDGIFSLAWDGFLVKNMEALHFLTEVAGVEKRKIRLDYNMYVMNREACDFWQEQGITLFTVPLEATRSEMETYPYLSQMELLLYGKVPLMVSAQCVYANTRGCGIDSAKQAQTICFQDQKKRVFEAVNYCKYCYNVIYQKEPVYLKVLVDQKQIAVSSMRYAFTTESPDEVMRILAGTVQEKTQTGHFEKGIE